MIPAKHTDRKGLYHPRLNAHGTDTIGYQVYSNGQGSYRIVNGAVASLVVVDWTRGYSEAIRKLRNAEEEAWK